MLKYAMTLTLGILGPLGAWAAHGLDNNWTVKVIGMKDANGCMQATSIEDLGSNLVRPDSVSCLSATQMCTDDYQCVEARALKPSTFQGCSFDASSGVEAEVTGVLMDGLCYQNFVVDQKNYNGGAGLAPDKVHVRSEAHLHTRACLVVSYCAKTGFYLLQRPSSTADYSYAAQMDSQAAEKVFDFLIDARHPTGMQIGKKITQKNKAKAAKSQDKDLSKALGRVASSLYIVTAKKAGVRHAMVASWVTPASSKPLGVSLTIAKERAMEPLLRIGDSFTLNLLEEGKPQTLAVMKHFLQRFAPGVDRLEGVDHIEGSNGAAVLRSACAYLECKIVSRMDAADHWVGYAEVLGGDVARSSATAAVHHRKVGTYY